MGIDYGNPLVVTLPYHFSNQEDLPTEVLAHRFQAWRVLIKDLVLYLKEYANVQEGVVRQQMRLEQVLGGSGGSAPSIGSHRENAIHANKDEAQLLNKYFLPIGNGSIQDLPTIVQKFHSQNLSNASKGLKELNSEIIPKLEELKKDLLVKIKEIKNLQNDFKNNLGKEIQETKAVLSQYNHAIDFVKKSNIHFNGVESDSSKFDPYLVKIKLERQLKKQLSEETYLHDAYENLQTAGGKLEEIIVQEIQTHVTKFLNIVTRNNSPVSDFLVPNLKNGFLAKEPDFEWKSFISHNSTASVSGSRSATFIDLNFPSRKMVDLTISDFNSPLNASIRTGALERRSKYLKSYSSGWYVLTCNFLHEFKTSDRKKDLHPVMSLPLESCLVSEHSKNDGNTRGYYKFVLYSKVQNGIIHRSHNWVFRTNTYSEMMDWYTDIRALTSAGSVNERIKIVEQKLKSKPVDKVISPSPSVVTSNARSIRTLGTNKSNNLESVRSHGTSIATSLEKNRRLSSTFSDRNGRTVGVNNMVNSDGTLITTTDTVNGKRSASPVNPNDSHLSAQGAGFVPQGNVQPGFYYANSYGAPSGQQFYDPVKQQYFTLGTPVQPSTQYFPQSPQLTPSQPIYLPQPGITRPVSPGALSGPPGAQTFYPVAVYPQPQNQTSFEGPQLPYPTNIQHPQELNDQIRADKLNHLDGISIGLGNPDDASINVELDNHPDDSQQDISETALKDLTLNSKKGEKKTTQLAAEKTSGGSRPLNPSSPLGEPENSGTKTASDQNPEGTNDATTEH